LEKLLSRAAASWNVAVASAYGFRHGFERPYVSTEHAQLGSVETWHSADGFFLLKGPDVRKAELKGAWVYDVAPTLLAFFGRRSEGPGRALEEILKFPVAPLRRIKPVHQRPGPALSQGSTAVRARHLLETRRYALAESLLRPLAESEEESVWAFLMGRSAHRTGRLEEAGEWLELAVELWPNELSSIIELSRVWEKQGQTDEAIELLGGLVQIFPEPDVYNAIADLYYNSLSCGHAEIYYRSATQIHLGQVLPYMRIAECLSRDGYLDEALHQLLESPLFYKAGFAYLAAGEAYLFHGKYDQALRAAADALTHDPDLWQAHLVRARALWAQGKKEDAEAAFEETVAMAPRRPEPLYQKALLLHAARESQEAFRHMIDVAERFPEFVPALVKAGVWAAEKDKRSLARDMLQAALMLEPRNMEARYTFDAHFSKKNS
jgi:tetratricopeptide (TPR) repeat protein